MTSTNQDRFFDGDNEIKIVKGRMIFETLFILIKASVYLVCRFGSIYK